uniref:Uncharacterized protein n=1 Tax=Rhizophora mucronata TaxID=61149 RepID=A0A2P2NU67_RHIMU
MLKEQYRKQPICMNCKIPENDDTCPLRFFYFPLSR